MLLSNVLHIAMQKRFIILTTNLTLVFLVPCPNMMNMDFYILLVTLLCSTGVLSMCVWAYKWVQVLSLVQ